MPAATRPPTRVLGVDPGLTRCGVGVVEGPVARPSLRHVAVLRTGAGTPLEHRLLELYVGLTELIETHEPDTIACERVLFSKNVRTAMATGQAAGVVLLAAARTGRPVTSYSPNDVKLAVAGHGGADKDAVARMVAAQLRLDTAPSPADAADALAIALTHLCRSPLAAAAGSGTGALTAAEADARAASRGGWEAVLARSHATVVGGNPARRQRRPGGAG